LYTAPALRTRIRGLAAKGTVHLIADLGPVGFLDSTGLGVLVGGLKRVREEGGSLTLVVNNSRILRVFQLTGLTKAFAISPSVADAVTADPHWRKTAETQAGSVAEWCGQNGLA
jgi:anti-sigma B factor antagonist